MQCSCGGMAIYKDHIVKGAELAEEWAGRPFTPDELPIKVGRYVCAGCGRESDIVYKQSGESVRQKAAKMIDIA